MPSVLREKGFDFRIYFSDHEPAHVHVVKGGGEVALYLDPVAIRDVRGLSTADVRRALAIAVEHRDYLMAKWEEING